MELFLVKPNLGNPLIFQPKDIAEGFELTFAGKTVQCPTSWQVLLELIKGILKLKKIDGSADFGLAIVGRPYRRKVYPKSTVDFPVTSQDHQYKTGFKWEYTVKVKSEHIGGNQKWPQMFDIDYFAERTQLKPTKTNKNQLPCTVCRYETADSKQLNVDSCYRSSCGNSKRPNT